MSTRANTINRRLLDKLTNNTTDMADSDMTVRADRYTCPKQFEAERLALFRNTPQPIAFSAELPTPGSYLTLDVLETPVLLTRDTDGQLQAFINACAHRGAKVASGRGVADRLVCGFHGWSYTLAGQLKGRPLDRCFSDSAQDCGLPRLPVSEKFGIVVIGTAPGCTAAAVDTALDAIGDELEPLGLREFSRVDRKSFSVRANWKQVTELSLESYHFRTLHRDSVATVLEPNAIVDTYQQHSHWAFPLKSIRRLEALAEADWPDEVVGSCTYTLYPGVMLIVNATGAQMIRAEPGKDVAHSTVSYVGVRSMSVTEEAARQAYDFGGEVFVKEDLPVAEQCQRGIESTGQAVVFGRNEPLLQFWHQRWQEALD